MPGQVVYLLDRPTYTYPQVDRLLGLTNGTAHRWLNGYRSGQRPYDPILRIERQDTRGSPAIDIFSSRRGSTR